MAHMEYYRKIKAIKAINDEIIKRIENKKNKKVTNGYDADLVFQNGRLSMDSRPVFKEIYKEEKDEEDDDCIGCDFSYCNTYYRNRNNYYNNSKPSGIIVNFECDAELIVIKDVFNDGLSFYPCKNYSQYKEMNEQMINIVDKWLLFGGSPESIEYLRDWLTNYEKIQSVLGKIEERIMDVKKDDKKEGEILDIIDEINNNMIKLEKLMMDGTSKWKNMCYSEFKNVLSS